MRVRIPRTKLSRLERGATAVIVAITATALLGMAAVSVDYASAASKKQEVQSAADAAAMEIARDCFKSEANCQATANAKAKWYADEIGADVKSVQIDAANNIVKVQIDADTKTLFAKAAFGDGTDSNSTVTSGAAARAKYENGTVVEYAPQYPLGFEYCAWKANGTTEKWYTFGDIPAVTSTAPSAACPDPRDNSTANLDGPHNNRAVLLTSDFFGIGKCELKNGGTISVWEVWIQGATNLLANFDTHCKSKFLELRPGQTILVPVYASYKHRVGSAYFASNPAVRVVGFAPFKIADGKPFKHQTKVIITFTEDKDRCTIGGSLVAGLLASGCFQIKGKFIETKEPFPDAVYGTEVDGIRAPVLGAVNSVVTLIL